MYNIFLILVGPDHMVIIVSPGPSAILRKWNLYDQTPRPSIPKFQNRPTYYIYYSYGAKRAPLSLTMDFEVSFLVLGLVISHQSLTTAYLISCVKIISPSVQKLVLYFSRPD